MQKTGSKPHRLRNAIVATACAAVIAAVAWALIRGYGVENIAHQAAVATTTGASANPEKHSSGNDTARVSKPARKLEGAVTGAALPPPGTPLAQTYDELKSRADAGDREAASRLFIEAKHCFRSRQMIRALPHAANLFLDEDTSKLSADELSRHEKQLADLEQSLAKAKSENELCEGLSDAQLQLTPSLCERRSLVIRPPAIATSADF